MQSAICLDRACHRIAESQIGLLRNSRETRMRPLVAPQFLTFTPPPPSLQRGQTAPPNIYGDAWRGESSTWQSPSNRANFSLIFAFFVFQLPGGKNFALSATLTLATIYFASRLGDLGGNLSSPRGIQNLRS